MPEHSRDPHPPSVPALGVAAVARRLGVATSTLRTWDRRYGLGPSEHVAGSRRRYTPRDLARLEVMRRLLLDGVTAAEAARAALATDLDLAGRPDSPLPAPTGSPRWRRAEPARGRDARPRPRAGGGRVVPLRAAGPAARGLARAAMSLDAETCVAVLVSALRRRGVLATWEELLRPVLTGVGERWRATGAGIEVEHLLSECAETALRTGVRPGRPLAPGRPVLLAALEPEDHRLPLVALAAALTERGLSHRLLGVHLPMRGLADAVRRLGPPALFLWSHGVHGPGQLPGAEVLAARPRPVLLLGGPGYADVAEQDARRDLIWVDGLATAVQALLSVAAPSVAITESDLAR